MSIRDAVKISFHNFRRHKVRTFLSVLGVIVGIFSLSLIVSLGQSVKSFVLAEVSAYGTNMLDITTKVPGKGVLGTAISSVQGIEVTTLKAEDFEAMEKFDFVDYQASFSMGQVWTTHQNKEEQVYLIASTPAYIKIDRQMKMREGRFFNEQENRGYKKVAVLGSEITENFFGEESGIGKRIKIKGHSFEVVGTMEERGEIMGFNFDNILLTPLQTGQKMILGVDYVREGIVEIKEGEDIELATERIESLLRRRHNITDPEKDDFWVMSSAEALEMAQTITLALNILLIVLASISLLVGGIGIMNVMLASLSERIREVGLRKAVGARDSDIMKQFLTEAAILTALGGAGGVFLGVLVSILIGFVAAQAGAGWQVSLSLFGFGAAFGVSLILGILFGIYPAKKAAELDPIEAIKKE